MSLADNCRKAFSSKDKQRGTSYFAEGGSYVLGVDGSVLNAEVSGSGIARLMKSVPRLVGCQETMC